MIGIFGGTFDPIHLGHLRPLLEVLQDLGLQEVRWIPSGQPPHRDQPQTSTKHRLAMLRLALRAMPAAVIDERELQRPGPSYMVETLESLRDDFPDCSMALILGLDAFNGLTSWHRWTDLLSLAHIIVCSRPGADLPVSGGLRDLVNTAGADDVKQLHDHRNGYIYQHTVTDMPISATMIRGLCRQGKSPRYLLTDAVCDYIEQQGLYINEVAITQHEN